MFFIVVELNIGLIYCLKFGVVNVIIIFSYGLINEVLFWKEFIKYFVGIVMCMRDVIYDSFIIVFYYEENWVIVYCILVFVFGFLVIK